MDVLYYILMTVVFWRHTQSDMVMEMSTAVFMKSKLWMKANETIMLTCIMDQDVHRSEITWTKDGQYINYTTYYNDSSHINNIAGNNDMTNETTVAINLSFNNSEDVSKYTSTDQTTNTFMSDCTDNSSVPHAHQRTTVYDKLTTDKGTDDPHGHSTSMQLINTKTSTDGTNAYSTPSGSHDNSFNENTSNLLNVSDGWNTTEETGRMRIANTSTDKSNIILDTSAVVSDTTTDGSKIPPETPRNLPNTIIDTTTVHYSNGFTNQSTEVSVVEVRSAGNYTCVSGDQLRTIVIDRATDSSEMSIFGTFTLERMYTLSLTCAILGKPLTDIKWYKDGVVIRETHFNTYLSGTTANGVSIYTKPYADYDDSGVYTCEVINAVYGKGNASVTVVIIERLIVQLMTAVPVCLDVIIVVAMVYLFWKFKIFKCKRKRALSRGQSSRSSIYMSQSSRGFDNDAYQDVEAQSTSDTKAWQSGIQKY